jgi:DedD protein
MSSASARKSGRRDWVVGSGRLVAAFVVVVGLCGAFFTLGYMMGQTARFSLPLLSLKSHTSAAGASSSKPGEAAGNASASPELDFYSLRDPGRTAGGLPAATSASAPGHASARPAGTLHPPVLPRGALVLQVAALSHEVDAVALADLLQQKDYPAFVLPNKSDKLFRVQVGPYKDTRSAEVARRALEREGFKTILKR